MSHYQEIVRDFLHAKRSVFVSPELKIQLNHDREEKGSYWYCDVVAIDMKNKTVYLCEVTYSKTLQALRKRFKEWDENWDELKVALIRDCGIEPSWSIEPWAFIPEANINKLSSLESLVNMPKPRVTFLESVTP